MAIAAAFSSSRTVMRRPSSSCVRAKGMHIDMQMSQQSSLKHPVRLDKPNACVCACASLPVCVCVSVYARTGKPDTISCTSALYAVCRIGLFVAPRTVLLSLLMASLACCRDPYSTMPLPLL